MERSILKMSFLQLTPANYKKTVYTHKEQPLDKQWNILQDLIRRKEYPAGIQSIEKTIPRALAENNTVLVKYLSLIQARLSVLIQSNKASEKYQKAIEYILGDQFTYHSSHSYNTTILNNSQYIDQNSIFIIEEYLINTHKKSTQQEYLFYIMILSHSQNTDLWSYSNTLDLSLLPEYFREIYTEYTMTRDNSITDSTNTKYNTSILNRTNTREYNNYRIQYLR
ncbi:hypothetical protein NEOKW01_0517 [Nematocida sp. AWRm80]|nr:hypothetical protein NEOKW01_0517 [Nematocida sp. AWRm80]